MRRISDRPLSLILLRLSRVPNDRQESAVGSGSGQLGCHRGRPGILAAGFRGGYAPRIPGEGAE